MKKSAGSVDTNYYKQTFYGRDRHNQSYLEIARYKDQFIISSDLFIDPVRFNLFSGFTRGFSMYDKYEKVYYVTLTKKEITGFIDFCNNSMAYSKTNLKSASIDYAFSENMFITLDLYYMLTNTSVKKPTIGGMTIWMKGRKFRIKPDDFLKAVGETISIKRENLPVKEKKPITIEPIQ
ncbi:MAG: hypothetical protein ACJ75J_13625 [Cytophagaceae bacterium]